MKNKVINLFNKPQIIVPNTGVKYSQLLEKFIKPFVNDFEDVEFYEDIFEFAISAWNSANMKILLPQEENDAVFDALEKDNINVVLLNKMIEYKINHFKNYTNFIVDYDLVETIEDPILKVTTQEQDAYLKSMVENFEHEDEANNYQENYINRSAIILKPMQPFIDWCSTLYPDDLDDIKETRTYLISEDIDDIDKWLSKKFDKLFTFELESWSPIKKNGLKKETTKCLKNGFKLTNRK